MPSECAPPARGLGSVGAALRRAAEAGRQVCVAPSDVCAPCVPSPRPATPRVHSQACDSL